MDRTDVHYGVGSMSDLAQAIEKFKTLQQNEQTYITKLHAAIREFTKEWHETLNTIDYNNISADDVFALRIVVTQFITKSLTASDDRLSVLTEHFPN